jgi:SagB-type dehydrogenase family enzyme
MADTDNFDDFWQASSLDGFNIRDFGAQLNAYDSDDKVLRLEYPLAATPLLAAKSRLNRIAKERKSERIFSDKPLTVRELSLLLSSFQAWNGMEHRGFPSAGATYATEIFCVTFNAEQMLNGKILYYDVSLHGVVELPGKAPSWKEAQPALNIEVTGIPQALILIVIFPERATAKYGERGGRFVLLEAGAAMQHLALQLAESKLLKGVAAGGTLDRFWLQRLQLDGTDARLALGYLVGR